ELGNVGRQDGDRGTLPDPVLRKRRGHAPGALVCLFPGVAPLAVRDRRMVGEHRSGALEELQRRQRREIRRIAAEMEIVLAEGDGLDRPAMSLAPAPRKYL